MGAGYRDVGLRRLLRREWDSGVSGLMGLGFRVSKFRIRAGKLKEAAVRFRSFSLGLRM